MLKQLLLILPLLLGSVFMASASEPSNEVVTGQMRGYHGAGVHHSVQDLRSTRNHQLSRERELQKSTNGAVVAPIVAPVTTPVVVPTTTTTPINPTTTKTPLVTPTTK